MAHVIVETNWIVDVAIPTLSRNPDALALLERARRRDVELHVPAICLVEARKVASSRKMHVDLGGIRSFIRDARATDELSSETANAAFDVLVRYQQRVDAERAKAPAFIASLATEPWLSIFPLDEEMLARSVALAAHRAVKLESFDLAIFASVLERGAELRDGDDVSFCTVDPDLQPWDKHGRRIELADLYDDAGVWVYGDFLLQTPARPDDWMT